MKRIIYYLTIIILVLITVKVALSNQINSSNYSIGLYGGLGSKINSSNYSIEFYMSDIQGTSNSNNYSISLGIFYPTITNITPLFCGDGVVSGVEQCDLLDYGGKSCLDYGHTAGSLSCTAGCLIDSSACNTPGGGGSGGGGIGGGTGSSNITFCLQGNIIKKCYCNGMTVTNGYCINNVWYPILNDNVINKTEQIIYNVSEFKLQFHLNNESYIIFNNINVSKIAPDQKLFLDFNIIPYGKYVQDILFTCEGNLCEVGNVLITNVTLGEQTTVNDRIIIFMSQLKSNTNYKMTLTGKGAKESHELIIKINTISNSYQEQVDSIFKKKIVIFGLEFNKWIVCCLLWVFLLLLSIFIKNHWIKLLYLILVTLALIICLIFV